MAGQGNPFANSSEEGHSPEQGSAFAENSQTGDTENQGNPFSGNPQIGTSDTEGNQEGTQEQGDAFAKGSATGRSNQQGLPFNQGAATVISGGGNTFSDTEGPGGVDFTESNSDVTGIGGPSWITILVGGAKGAYQMTPEGVRYRQIDYQGRVYWLTKPSNDITLGSDYNTAAFYTGRG